MLAILVTAPLATGALLPAGASEQAPTLQVDLPGVDDVVQLAPGDPRDPGIAQAGGPAEGLYEGRLAGTGGLVHLVHTDQLSVGLVETPQGPTWVTRTGDLLVPLTLEEAPLPTGQPVDTERSAPGMAQGATSQDGQASPKDGTLQIMLDSDRSFWVDFRGEWEIRQLQIIHLVDAIYQANLGVQIEVVEQHAWIPPGENPLTSNELCAGPDDLLDQFRTYWETTAPTLENVREAAHLFTTRPIDGTVIGCAFVGTLESPWAYGVSEVSGSFTSTGLYRDVVLTSHELGHNFDGRHGRSAGVAGCIGGTIMWPILCYNNPTFYGSTGTAGGVCPDAGVDCAGFGNAAGMRDHAEARI